MDAIYLLELKADETLTSPMTTDGISLFYHPVFLSFLHDVEGIEGAAYCMMHLCSHCILGHLPARPCVQSPPLFDVLADYKVHRMLSALWTDKQKRKTSARLPPSLKLPYEFHPLNQVYHRLEHDKKKADKYKKYAQHLQVDDHELWYRQPNQQQSLLFLGGNGESSSIHYVTLEKWREIKEKMEEQSAQSVEGRGLSQAISQAVYHYDFDRISATDYTTILRQFLQKSIVELENHHAIDPVWYHFGLDYLGNIPLIEPLEEDETPREGTLLLAIDTSGSCEGYLCHRFLGELSSMMAELETMVSLSQVVLFQCDWEIQEEIIMESPEAWSQMMDHFEIKGGGGTDFCPVFEASQKYENVVGLIYLSDGYGDFPYEPPAYPTLFMLTEDSGTIPPWVDVAYF